MNSSKNQAILLCTTTVAAVVLVVIKWRKSLKTSSKLELENQNNSVDVTDEPEVAELDVESESETGELEAVEVPEVEVESTNLEKRCDETNDPNTECENSGLISVQLPHYKEEFPAYRRRDSDGSSWIVVQQRHCGQVDFERGWAEYEHGFGRVHEGGEFWLGLKKLAAILKKQPRKIRFVVASYEVTYKAFMIGDSEDKYSIKSLGEYAGNLGDYLKVGSSFHTFDSKHAGSGNLAVASGGGWWFSESCFVNLNSFYQPGLETRMEISF